MKDSRKELLTVKEASELLNLNEKKLYALAGSGKIPGTKITGKWIFPRTELEQFLKSKSLETVRGSFWESLMNNRIVLISGSDDPIISTAQGLFHALHTEYLLFSSSVGSREGIRLLKNGFCTIAVSHQYDYEKEDFTFPLLDEYFDDPGEVVVMNLFFRNIGFVTRDIPIRSLGECIRSSLRFVNRQEGSGIRSVVEHLIRKEGINTAKLKGYDTEVFTHFDVVRSVASEMADAGIVAQAAAASSRLVFEQIFEERFDMIVKKEVFFDRHVQAFVDFIRSDQFRNLLNSLKGYNDRETGRVMYPRYR
jgi:putative molybdopterin biosynthesis protein